jgi:HD-like signal output (HDOD) protein
MPSIPTESLEAGMRLATDVLNSRGQVLIPGGTAIEAKHLRGLRAWGIKSVCVTLSSAPEDVVAVSGMTVMSAEEIDRFIATLFAHNEAIAETALALKLKTMARDRLVRFGLCDAARNSRVSMLRDPEAPPDKKLSMSVDELIGMATSIATLPNIYFELQNVMKRPLSASADMANAIRSDPGLTARLLRVVNSAYYAFPSQIETVSRAVTIVGTNELTSLVTATSVLKTFGAGVNDLFDMNVFWRHSIGAGVIARILGAKRHEQNIERFFVMGLLHDIGRVLMFSHIPKYAKAAHRRALVEKLPLSQVESEDVGFSHSAVGAALARNWRMSAGQQEAISYHHRPSFAMRYRTETAVTHIADALSHVLSVGQCPNVAIQPIEIEAWERLELKEQVLETVFEEADQQVRELIDIFFTE